MFRQFSRHVRHNLVTYVAPFVALGGTSAWAAGQISGTQIKDESITGVDVLDDSLSGADLDESTLRAVPNATKAGDADTLDGKDSSDFL